MNLFDVREQFIKQSGRRDLTDEYGFDNGADYFINSGLRMLDRMVTDEVPTDNTYVEDDDDENFWMLNYPDLVTKAALQRLEVSYRNTAGANDWLTSLKLDLIDLDMELLEESIAGVDEMEG